MDRATPARWGLDCLLFFGLSNGCVQVLTRCCRLSLSSAISDHPSFLLAGFPFKQTHLGFNGNAAAGTRKVKREFSAEELLVPAEANKEASGGHVRPRLMDVYTNLRVVTKCL